MNVFYLYIMILASNYRSIIYIMSIDIFTPHLGGGVTPLSVIVERRHPVSVIFSVY